MEKYSELREAVESVPAIDAHAHNLVALDSNFPFLRCFSEAEGDALSFAPDSLSFKRSIKDLAKLYNCMPTLNDVQRHRELLGLQSVGSRCFTQGNISAVLIDDGIMFDKMHEKEWHSCLIPAVGRILRIEFLAEKILNGMSNRSEVSLESFTETFMAELKSVSNDIIALKSIAAYRSGLEIDTHVNKKAAEAGLLEDIAKIPVRVQNKNFINYMFTCSLESALYFDLPVQIHTGFGDKDADLKQCNPLLLRTLLEDGRFSKCRFVLLHASYPFSREASYLASVYSNVYLDFGLAIPKLSVYGMETSVKELLELAPVSKVMFSTDGYAFPETFYLGAKRAREVIYSVLSSACDDGDLSVSEAIEAVDKIFRKNALYFYNFDKATGSIKNSQPLNIRSTGRNPEPENTIFVRIIWVDNSGKHRCRVIPAKRFYNSVKICGVGLAYASMAMPSYTDGPADGSDLDATGEIRLIPDLSTKHSVPWVRGEEMVLADMQIKPGKIWEYCPRNILQRIAGILKEEFNLDMNAGFENEFYLLRSTLREGVQQWVSIDSASYCSTSAYDALAPVFQELFSTLDSMGIELEQLHAESGNGQFEISLGHTICKRAADNLIFVREAIRSIARKHGLLATFAPKYFLDTLGSGSHVHLSLWENGKNVFMASEMSDTRYGMSKVGEKFMAGVLHHLPSILAIIAPIPNSYDRIQPNSWTGAYQCWGKENREAALRTACPPGVCSGYVSNFEIKSFDGCANPHIGLASIIAAGIDGLRQNRCLPEPIDINPSIIHSKVKRLPTQLSESVAALESNIILKDLLGEKVVTVIIAIRKAEIAYYAANKDAFKQLIDHY